MMTVAFIVGEEMNDRRTAKEKWQEARAAFYVSGVWIDCARSYRTEHPLCERCLAKREISISEQVHHKIKLSPQNINNPDIVLNWENLEALCDKCHKEEHIKERRANRKHRWSVDENGKIRVQDTPLGHGSE